MHMGATPDTKMSESLLASLTPVTTPKIWSMSEVKLNEWNTFQLDKPFTVAKGMVSAF